MYTFIIRLYVLVSSGVNLHFLLRGEIHSHR